MRTLFFLLFCVCLIPVIGLGQNIHLSQIEASPLFLNPALGGQFHGDWQAGATVREQWRSIGRPYQSFLGFYDQRIHIHSKQFNAGALFIHDRSGNANLTSEKVFLSLAYPLTQGRSTISVGIQPGIVMRFYNDYLTFPEQYDHSTGTFNRDLSNNETGIYGNTNRTFFDLNAGVYWRLKLPKIRPSVGLAFFHLNQADESFNQIGEKLSIRQNIHADVKILLDDGFYLRPAYYFSGQKKANEMLMGTDFGIYINKENNSIREVFAGMYFRNGYLRNTDSYIAMAGLQYSNWRFGFSYDVNISELDAASNNRGAFELSVIYRAPSTEPKHTAIPCDRY